MSKIRVAIAGTVGKSVSFDPSAGARAEAAVAALAAQISAGIGGTIYHRNLRELQVGDDHPQYAGWQFPETIVGQWNFQTIPQIQGATLAEYIQDVVGADFFDFLQDTSSVVWTYLETANELEANVPPEFVQDTVADFVQDTGSVAWTYGETAGTLEADVVFANPSGLIGMSAVNGTAATPLRSDGRHAIDPAIAPTWTSEHRFSGTLTGGSFTDLSGISLSKSGGSDPIVWFRRDGSATDEKNWAMIVNAAKFDFRMYDDAGGNAKDLFSFTRSGNAVATVQFGNASDNPLALFLGSGSVRLAVDNKELQIGAGQDLRLYHDGSDSWVQTDTGELRLSLAGAQSFRLTAGAFAFRSTTARGSGNCYASLFDPTGEKGYFGYGAATDDFYVANSLNGDLKLLTNAVEVGRFDTNATAGNTRFMVYDVDNATLERVSVGAADSGGVGFKVLRIPN